MIAAAFKPRLGTVKCRYSKEYTFTVCRSQGSPHLGSQ